MKNNETPDSVLIERVQRGDMASLDLLIARYQEAGYRYAFRLTGHMEDAANLVADSFVKMYRSIQTFKGFKGEHAFIAWTYRTITHTYLDQCGTNFACPLLNLDSPVLTSNAVEKAFQANLSGRPAAILAGLQELPAYEKAILVLHHLQSLSCEQIAEIMQTPVGKMQYRLNQASLLLSTNTARLRPSTSATARPEAAIA